MIDLSGLKRPTTPNTALYADPGDTASKADAPALRFSNAPADVFGAWQRIVADAPRTKVLHADPAARTHHAVQRSPVFRFPDDVYARAIPDGSGTRFVLYSAARYGKGDFGKNRERLETWSKALIRALAGAPLASDTATQDTPSTDR